VYNLLKEKFSDYIWFSLKRKWKDIDQIFYFCDNIYTL
jgi:hypothetical protein